MLTKRQLCLAGASVCTMAMLFGGGIWLLRTGLLGDAQVLYIEDAGHMIYNLVWELQSHYELHGRYPANLHELPVYTCLAETGSYPTEATRKGMPFPLRASYPGITQGMSYTSDGNDFQFCWRFPKSPDATLKDGAFEYRRRAKDMRVDRPKADNN
jgi:hypothetical protein